MVDLVEFFGKANNTSYALVKDTYMKMTSKHIGMPNTFDVGDDVKIKLCKELFSAGKYDKSSQQKYDSYNILL